MPGRCTTTLSAGLLVGALASGAAAARPKPVCNLITDPAGDAATPLGRADSLDVISADVASDGVDLTVVIRLSKYVDPEVSSPVGRRWVVTFTLPGRDTAFYLRATYDPILLAPAFEFGAMGAADPAGRPTYLRAGNTAGTVDAARQEIRMHLPLSDFNRYDIALRPGAVIRSIKAFSYAMSNNYHSVHDIGSDSAETSTPYRIGRASCVKVGL